MLVAWDVAIVAVTVLAWLYMATIGGHGAKLSEVGLWSLKYYTVLSNILSAVACGWQAWLLAHGEDGRAALTLKLAATTSVAVTFLVVLLFLGPAFGLASMYVGANLVFHLMGPLMAMFGLCALDHDGCLAFFSTFKAAIPTLLYAIGYYVNILVNGVGEWPNTNDWYGFTQWGMEWAPVVFAVMLAFSWLVALALRAVRGLGSRR